MSLVTHVLDRNKDTVAVDTTDLVFGNEFEQNLAVPDPILWSPESPYLYTVISSLYKDNKLQAVVKQQFGIRSIKYEPHK